MNINKLFGILFLIISLFSCKKEDVPEPIEPPVKETELIAGLSFSELIDGQVYLTASLKNKESENVLLKEILIKVKSISNPKSPVVIEKKVGENITINSGQEYSVSRLPVITVTTSNLTVGSYGLFLEYRYSLKDEAKIFNHYCSYFRILSPGQLSTYSIEKENYSGLDIFKLRGGMSAEFAVQKALTSLKSGVSHTWKNDAFGGPERVYGNPDFLEKSVQYTVDLYNEQLGENTPVKTVIISTGLPCVPYLSNAMKAPVLPLHFLLSVNTAKEVQSVLDYSQAKNLSTYATLGYDGSMSGVGVAWIKLLDLPSQYAKFIEDHQVEQVILLGVGQSAIGESYARKVIKANSGDEYAPGSLYILYTGYGSQNDINELTKKIIDFNSLKLDEARLIADWESGITNSQVDQFSASLKSIPGVNVYSIAPNDMMVLYNSSTYFTLELFEVNKQIFVNDPVKGVVLNEYLTSHPAYELANGYLPFLYWQFNPAKSTIDRVDGYIKSALKSYYPDKNMVGLNFFLNSNYGRQSLRNELTGRGYVNITENTDPGDIWDNADGMNKRCEKVANEIIANQTPDGFKNWNNSLTPIGISNLNAISARYPGFKITKR